MNSTLLQIPINQIKPSANNPRKVITPEAVEAVAASLKSIGQQTPIKLRKLEVRSEELGVKTTSNQQPEIPTSQDAPIGAAPLDDGDYILIGGHIRLEAAKRLGWETLNALVLDVTPEQAELAAIMDNQGEDMHWLDWYQAIERRMNGPEKRTQQQVAEELGISQKTISRALKLMGVLNLAAREAIYTDGIKNDISEMAVFRLADLADPKKPLDQARVDVQEALKVVIDKRLTEPQAKRLVKWVKAGNKPEDYGKQSEEEESPAANAKTPSLQENQKEVGDLELPDTSDPNAGLWVGLPEGCKIFKAGGKYQVIWLLDEGEAPVAVYSALAGLAKLKESHDDRWEKKLEELLSLTKGQLGVSSEELGVKENTITSSQVTGDSSQQNSEDHKGQEPTVATEVKPAESTNPPQAPNLLDHAPLRQGFLGQVKSMVKEQLKTAPGEVAEDLERDGKSAVNTVLKQAMRRYIKDMF
jgi:ParB/RepB/Spo0J family partition protein